MAAARALYEGTPGMTLKACAEQTGLGKSTIEKAANEQGWKKNHKFGDMTEQAQKAADMFKRKIEEFGPEASAEEKQQVVAEVVQDVAIDARAAMLDRHRREWAAPRAMSAEAVKMRETRPGEAFDRAKLAKITAETLKIVQDGERKAWGLDVGEVPPGSVVVIERA
ncbi:MAG: hypothetical protein ABFE07_25620 [Armatimonadia bacterium]